MKEVTLKWGPIECECDECICHTEVSFREEGSTNWYTPTSPTNPTKNLEYKILVNEGIYYQVRLTFIGPLCQSKSTYFSLYFPLAACCPSGYTMSPDSTYCYKIEEVAATPPSGSPATLVASRHASYSTCGTYIYNTGYSINGTGTSNQISTANTFWANGAGLCANAGSGENDGPLNRTGVWAGAAMSNQDVGFAVCVDLPSSKTYYIGIGTDNYGIIKVDGVTLVQQDPTALGTQYGSDAQITFKIWHVYPVFITAGPHIIELIGHNNESSASLGCEIYDATSAELIAATSYTDLTGKLIFSSKDEIGEPAQIGTVDAGYTCPAGYSLAPCASPIKCRRVITTAPIDCFSS